ncbi:hypothetical protein Lal_00039509 [Lupinus albus]|nr:hypothetical protein Lal_00039509 [Lupinus albus]
MKSDLPNQIIVEREGFAFFVSIEYDNLPVFCVGCQAIGHVASASRKLKKELGVSKPTHKKVDNVSKVSKENPHQDLDINLEIDINDNVLNLERVVSTPGLEGQVDSVQEDSSETESLDKVDSGALMENQEKRANLKRVVELVILRTWNIEEFGNVHLKVNNALASFEDIQDMLNGLGQDLDLIEQEQLA